MARFATWTLMLFLPLSVNAADLQPFKAEYTADIGSVSAKATRELKQNDNGEWQLSQKAENFFASVSETSEFTLDQHQLISQRYEYLRKAFGSRRHALLAFDWANHTVNNDVEGQPWSYTIEPKTLDKLNFQLQLRLDLLQHKQEPLVYAVADGGVLKEYRFKIIGEEFIETDIGQLNTLKVQRVEEQKSDKETWLWFSTAHDYLLVKYVQTKDKGKKKTELLVTAIEAPGA